LDKGPQKGMIFESARSQQKLDKGTRKGVLFALFALTTDVGSGSPEGDEI